MTSSLAFDAETHTYRVGSRIVPGVTSVMRAALGSPFDKVAGGVLEQARRRGTAVHRACELYDRNRLDWRYVDERILPYVHAWVAFREVYRFEVLLAEVPLYSAVHGFAGTPDCVIRFPDQQLGVLDRKTGLPGPLAALQTAGYGVLAIEHFEFGAMPRRFALQMRPTGRYSLEEYDSPRDWPDFMACLTIARLKERIAA